MTDVIRIRCSVVAFVILALVFVTCRGADEDAESEKIPPCGSVAVFDDLTVEVELNESAVACVEAGVGIEVIAARYSADFQRYELEGTFDGADARAFLYPVTDPKGRRCYMKLVDGPFRAAIEYRKCLEGVSFAVLNEIPKSDSPSSYEEHVLCRFGFDNSEAECEEQPAGEDD
ncbi:MAG: hypothetical protein IT350_03980 [Deltaproteobacteria bacterium]|nr:hypothetical protein [Deltaproteobacteria bacterium]